MKASIDCIPCFIRQTLEAARMVSSNPADHETIIRTVLRWAAEIDLSQPPPAMGQQIHRYLREVTGQTDPYRLAKERQNRMALELLPWLKSEVEEAENSLDMSVRLAIAGNVIDMGVSGQVEAPDVRTAIEKCITAVVYGQEEEFHRSAAEARTILYLADNAGEIVFDRLLIEQLDPARVTLAVRGGPVINDAIRADAEAAGLQHMVPIIDNGSDAPGTLLNDCSREFRHQFAAADMIIAKGHGNYESLSQETTNIFFLLKAKCPVIAGHIGVSLGTHVLMQSGTDRPDRRLR
jgi:uncharacterized protein with ATP-grasp and redox domains